MDLDNITSPQGGTSESNIPSISQIFGEQGGAVSQNVGAGSLEQVQGQVGAGAGTSDPEEFELAQAQGRQDFKRVASIFQSRYDKLNHEVTKGRFANFDQLQQKASLADQLLNDQDYRRAFLAETEPELFKQSAGDVESFVEQTLLKEFGEDFQPDDEVAKRKPWTKDARYYKRAEELYNEFNKKHEVKGLKDLMAERQQAQQAEAEKNQQILTGLKQKHGWDDATVKQFGQFVQNITPDDYAVLFNRLINSNQAVRKSPNITQHAGGSYQVSKARQIFGDPNQNY
jgi:hypothetical protein